MSDTRKLPVKTIAARPRLIAETQPPLSLGKPFRQLGNLIGAVRKCPSCRTSPPCSPSGTATATVALCTSKHTNMVVFHLAPPPCLRLGVGRSGLSHSRRGELPRAFKIDGSSVYRACLPVLRPRNRPYAQNGFQYQGPTEICHLKGNIWPSGTLKNRDVS
jgi:hypothetical protein